MVIWNSFVCVYRRATTINHHSDHLVGGIPPPLKNMKVSWDDYSQYMEK